MSVSQLLSTVVCVVALAWPSLTAAAYRIQLRNGRHVVTSQYWKEGHTVMFYTDGGVGGIPESAVLSVQMVEEPPASDRASVAEQQVGSQAERQVGPQAARQAGPQAGQKVASQGEVQQDGGKRPKLDLEAYQQKKEEFKAQLDMAVERYREASSTHNNEEKIKIQREITAWSKKLFDLTDEVKQKNQGRLPEGWENF
jgi:hypothetical protein